MTIIPDKIIQELILIIPIIIGSSSIISIVIKKIRNWDRKIDSKKWVLPGVSAYVVLYNLVFIQNYEAYKNEINILKTFIKETSQSSIQVVSKTDEKDLTQRISKILDDHNDEEIELTRSFVIPNIKPGMEYYDDDVVLGNTFFATAYSINYFLKFNWNDDIQNEYEINSSMINYLLDILTYPKWGEFSSNTPLIKRKKLFHIPESDLKEFWSIESQNKSYAGLIFISSDPKSRLQPKRANALLFNDDLLANVILLEKESLFQKAKKHLDEELKKVNPWERCLCTLFIDDKSDGMQPMSLEVIESKFEQLDSQYKLENEDLSIISYPNNNEIFKNILDLRIKGNKKEN